MTSPRDEVEARVEAWRAMLYANDRLMRRLSEELMAAHGLEMSWYEVLMHVAQAGGTITQRDLLGRTLLGQSGLSRVLARMQAEGLVHRSTSATDRRTLHVELTALGRERLRRAAPTHVAGIRRWFGDRLTARQAEALRAGLRKVVRGLDEDVPLGTRGQQERSRPAPIGPAITSLTQEPVALGDAILVRDALEPLVVADAVRCANAADVTDLRRLLTTMTARVDDPIGFLKADWSLHRRIGEISPNDILRESYLPLLDVLESHVEAVLPTDGLGDYLHSRLRLHATLVDAIEAGDGPRAAELVAEHKLTSARALGGALTPGAR